MHTYQTANKAEQMMEMGRKVLKIDPDDPEALVGVAQVLAERTRDSDLDKDQRLDEGTKMAQHAVETTDTDITVPPGTPQDKIDAYKGFLRSTAYYVLGTIQYTREKYADAEGYFRKSLDAFPSQPDPLAVLRLALSLDKQEKYPEALKFANQAVQTDRKQPGLDAGPAVPQRTRPAGAADRRHTGRSRPPARRTLRRPRTSPVPGRRSEKRRRTRRLFCDGDFCRTVGSA